jgi:hypothetical protein
VGFVKVKGGGTYSNCCALKNKRKKKHGYCKFIENKKWVEKK